MATTIVGKYIECKWCNKNYTTPRYMVRYKEDFFCDDTCLGEYMVDQADGDTEAIWFDTPENIEMRELEKRAEW